MKWKNKYLEDILTAKIGKTIHPSHKRNFPYYAPVSTHTHTHTGDSNGAKISTGLNLTLKQPAGHLFPVCVCVCVCAQRLDGEFTDWTEQVFGPPMGAAESVSSLKQHGVEQRVLHDGMTTNKTCIRPANGQRVHCQ